MDSGRLKILYALAFLTRSALTELLRDQLLQKFRSHLDDYSNGEFENPRTIPNIGLTVTISKKDTICNGTAEPSYHIEFDVPNARPVDVFNTLADATTQPQWLCDYCTVDLLKNDLIEKVQATTSVWPSGPLKRRRFFQWSALHADFENQTFLIGTSGDMRTGELQALPHPEEPGVVVATMCYSISYITPGANGGAHVVQLTHFNAHIPTFFGLTSPRHLYNYVWPNLVNQIPRIITQSQRQATLQWGPYEVAFSPRALIESADIQADPCPKATARAQFEPNTTSEVLPSGHSSGGDSSLSFKQELIAASIAIALCCCIALTYSCFRWCCGSAKGGHWRNLGDGDSYSETGSAQPSERGDSSDEA